ncbi:MAG: KH domain-containing protein [Veillonellaceae bacterium]|nr:KH domain-containing protein [Veillonellaceae bacterium]
MSTDFTWLIDERPQAIVDCTEMLLTLIKNLVKAKARVTVSKAGDKVAVFSILPETREDGKKLIGSKGHIASALRTIVDAIGRSHDLDFSLDVAKIPEKS